MTEAPHNAGETALGIADHRREQMLRAALEVIAERGYADTRIADVAERTGISPALVIYYFKTKDQLLTEAIRYSEDAWYADGQRRLAALPTAAARVEEIVAMSCLPEADPEP
ncbi:MAG TPA: TetR family transcriptional regulator, partial [Streptosporangiaceae bacterium]|nr:TetR family transcriptional regulator [Streptosporangiaceae bacterium]